MYRGRLMTQNPNQEKISWDDLYKQERFKPVYPLDHIIRNVFTQFPRDKDQRKKLRLLDLGCGAGRHVVFLAREGFQAYGTDLSMEGVLSAQEWLKSENLSAVISQAEMSIQPFPDNYFDGIICVGVIYYNDIFGIKKTISEIHRILKKQGILIIITRTTDDYRYGKGKKIEENTYRLDIDDTNEKGMIMHFVDVSEIMNYFKKFDIISLEKTETTFSNRINKNSDWIVVVRER